MEPYDALSRLSTVLTVRRDGLPVDSNATQTGNQPEATRYHFDLLGRPDYTELILAPFQVSTVSEAVFRKLDAGIRCDTEVEFDKTISAFFKEHKIKGWDALPRMFQHIVVRRINADSILVTCFEHRSGDGYVSENKAVDIAASSTALENALGYCFDSLRKKSKSS